MSSDTPSKRHPRQPRNTAHNTLASSSAQQPQNHHAMSHTIGAVEPEYIVPSTPPRTPHKNNPPATQSKSKSVPPESQHKLKNKPRPKNLNSPALTKSSRQHSPTKSASMSSSTKPITTPSSAAYAGSTFHASPAPSALPIPSYYSKSVPESPAGRLLLRNREASNGGSHAASDAENGPETSRERTPLDFLFEADRQDKERARSASNNQQESQAAGPFQPPYSPSNTRTPPAGPLHGRPPNSHRHSGGLFPFEMDSPNNARSPIGPAFSTPYNERMKAARATSDQHVSQVTTGQPPSKAEDLKRYLFDGILPPQPSFVDSQQSALTQQTVNMPQDQRDSHRNGNQNRRSQPFTSQTPRNNRYSGLRQEVTPTTTPNTVSDHNVQMNTHPFPNGQHWTPSKMNYGMETSEPTYQGPLMPQSPNKHTREMSDLDNHLRSVLNLGPAKNS